MDLLKFGKFSEKHHFWYSQHSVDVLAQKWLAEKLFWKFRKKQTLKHGVMDTTKQYFIKSICLSILYTLLASLRVKFSEVNKGGL